MGSDKTKPITELSDEELLSLAESEQEVIRLQTVSDIESFITRYQITSGPLQVNSNSIYKFYRLWSERPLQKPQFTEELGIFLNQPDTGTYLINKAPIEFTEKKKPKYELDLRSYYQFVQDEKIESGKVLVNIEVVRRLFNKWAAKNKAFKASLKKFRTGISKFFKIETIDKQDYIRVNKYTSKKLVGIVHEEQEKAQKQKRSD